MHTPPTTLLAARLAAALASNEEPLDAALRRCVAVRGPQPTTIASRSWTSEAVQRLRVSEVYGPEGLYVANVGLLPAPQSNLPVVHAELVVTGGVPRVLLLDARELPGTRAFAGELLGEHSGAVRRETFVEPTRPEWADGLFSDSALWVHGSGADALEPAVTAFHDFLDRIVAPLARRATATSSTEIGERRSCLERLRTTFLAHEPSRPFLRTMFGGDWAERYMSEFLFPAPRPESSRADRDRSTDTEAA